MDGGDVEVVLGVSMTPEAVRMVLVEGADADGVTVDHLSLSGSAGSVEQVVAAILGTRESVIDSGHRLANVGVAWTDHSAAARLRDALRPLDIVEVTLVSELHAASALAVAIGRKTGCRRIALLFVGHDRVTLAVVQTADGAVVRVSSRSLGDAEAIEDVPGMVAALETAPDPPQEVFVVGPGAAADSLTARIAATTALTAHRPGDAELALARGAALACATVPRFDAETVGLGSAPDWFHDAGIGPDPQAGTEAGPTLLADAGRELGYSAFPAEAAPAPAEGARWDAGGWGEGTRLEDTGSADTGSAADNEPPAERPVLLLGSALTTVFVIGFVALVISLAITIRPAVDSRPAENATGTGEPAAPETIRAPVPVAREAPRAVVVPMPAAVPPPAAAVPVPAAAPPAPPAALPAPAVPAPPPAVSAPAAPGAGPTLAAPQILVPEVIAALLPPALRGPTAPAPRSTTPAPSVEATTAEKSPPTSPATSPAAPTASPTSAAPSSPPQATSTQDPTTDAGAQTTSQQSATNAATGSTSAAPATEPAAQPTPAQTVLQGSAPAPTTTTAPTAPTAATPTTAVAPARSSAPDCASPAECPA